MTENTTETITAEEVVEAIDAEVTKDPTARDLRLSARKTLYSAGRLLGSAQRALVGKHGLTQDEKVAKVEKSLSRIDSLLEALTSARVDLIEALALMQGADASVDLSDMDQGITDAPGMYDEPDQGLDL